MAPWALLEGSKSPSRIFQRPLSYNESGFYWDGVFNGTADVVLSSTVECHDLELLKEENVLRTWLTVRQKYPLLNASVEEHDGEENPLIFTVREELYTGLAPGEVQFLEIGSDEEYQEIEERFLNGPRCLSNDRLCQFFFVRRTDVPSKFHFLCNIAHLITDGVANASLLRDFMDMLASGVRPQYDLEQRLSLAVADEDLLPSLKLSVARQRWHRAIGAVIFAHRRPLFAQGHTLPRLYTSTTLETPATSCLITTTFSKSETSTILQSCRKRGLTFGNTFAVLGQVALTRVLCRRYVRGEMSRQEWEWRRREQMYTAGPLNLRPFLDQEWYDRGGATDVAVHIQFTFYPLLYMPLGKCTGLAPGDEVPSYLDLLSEKRFFYRATLLRREADKFIRHSRFLDIAMALMPSRLERVKNMALNWRNSTKVPVQGVPIAVQDSPGAGIGGSSFGNVDKLRPRHYPISDPKHPKLTLLQSGDLLHCRSTELYLGASTSDGELHVFVFWDGNVYERDVVEEWLGEVKGAISCYLGGGDIRTRL